MHPSSRTLFRAWEATRGEMSAARKQDLDLKRISGILPSLCILQRDHGQPVYRWRLAGTAVCRIWGKELTGHDVLAGWPDFEQQTMSSAFDMVIATLQPCVARFRAVNNHGAEVGLEFIALPIQDSKTGALQILGAVSSFRSPDWLGTTELVNFELSAMRQIWTDNLPGGTLEGAANFPGRPRPKHPPFLKVIDGGKTY